MRSSNIPALGAALLLASALPALAQDKATELDVMQVTATRTGEAVDRVPASITVIRGDELRARGAYDLRSALAGVAGVEISQGGDNGPGGSVPAFWGLREFDAFLLVVDGVPAGGAFNPALVTLDLNNIERIEVLRGSAPVMYGATSFVGVIHVIHYAAGASENRMWLGGRFDQITAGASTTFGDIGSWKQSLSFSGESRELGYDDSAVHKGHVLWRSGGDLWSGSGHFDVDLTYVQQRPDSPVVRQGPVLASTPVNANYNPSDAEFKDKRVQLNGGYDTHTGWGEWSSLVSLAFTKANVLRGFLEDPSNPPPNADGYEQDREVTDVYLDSHLSLPLTQAIELTYGFDAMVGKAKQESEIFEYTIDQFGDNRPDSSSGNKLKEGEAEDERTFAGLYAQADWKALERLDVLAGVRLNSTHEMREGEREEDLNMNGTIEPNEEFQGKETETLTRLTGMLGASWRFWDAGDTGSANLYADVRNSFKPAAFEFGPENEAEIPKAETALSYEAGVKTQLADRLDVDASWFYQDFRNVFLLEGNDIRKTRLSGAELEALLHVTEAFRLFGSYAYHDARFVKAAIDTDGDRVADFDVSGNRFEMSPQRVASFGLQYMPSQGFYGFYGWNYTGDRFLNKRNTAPANAYATTDATFGYRFRGASLALQGYNLSNRRDPTAESEFSEVVAGAPSYYRVQARHIDLVLSYQFGK